MKRMAAFLFALIMLFSLLAGCAEDDSPVPIGSEVWETMPQLTYGVMEYEKLQILPWNSGRCEATSYDMMAETDLGYYLLDSSNRLLYADKTDQAKWMPVCSKPNCNHTNADPDCSSHILCPNFVIRNGTIYYQMMHGHSEYYTGDAGFVLMRMAPAGSDRALVHAFDEEKYITIKADMSLLTSQHWIYNVVEMSTDGNHVAHSFRLSDKGVEKLITRTNVEDEGWSAMLQTGWYVSLHGDRVVLNGAMDESPNVFFRFTDAGVERLDFTDLPVMHSYLSGDILRFYRSNDGYYDINIQTGEEVKLADAQMDHAVATIVLPNCIVESTLLTPQSIPLRSEGMAHSMRVFDGQQWHDVALPPEMLDAGKQVFISVKCITSDCILFYSRDLATYRTTGITNFYCIDLNNDTWELEYAWEER